MRSICKYSLEAKKKISMKPMKSSWMGVMRPSRAPILIRTLAAATSAPIMESSDSLMMELIAGISSRFIFATVKLT